MPEFSPTDRFTPSLLDRLTDFEPGPQNLKEARSSRSFSAREYLASVKRDLLWLISTARLERGQESEGKDEQDDLFASFPHVATSVINYGTPSIIGCVSGTMKLAEVRKQMRRGQRQHEEGARVWDIQGELREAIEAFEPRIDPATLSVSVQWKNVGDAQHELNFIIQADLIMQPDPELLDVRLTLDLETGEVNRRDGRKS